MDRPTRVRALSVALLVLVAALGLQVALADGAASGVTRSDDGVYPGNTLVTVQSYRSFARDNGKAFVVAPNGTVLWEYDPPNSRVFDAEALESGNVLVSVATRVPAERCPEPFGSGGDCVRNRVVELDPPTNAVVWNYSRYDHFIEFHEVHDADRLPGGETAIVDMGNDRAFTVNRSGAVTWSWDARTQIGPGSEFWEEYVPADARERYRPEGPESDWTHMNDIDRLRNGNVQLSIRNFDVVLEVDPDTNRIVGAIGRPGNHDVMREQHDPNRIGDTVLVADSKNDRVVEVTPEGEVVWRFTGDRRRLQWPRDADRLPNGNTLVVDSRNFRVLEVNASGGVVWEYSLREEVGIVYDADRLGIPEEPDDVPSGRQLTGGGPADSPLGYVASWLPFVLPPWMGLAELLTALGALVAGAWLAVEVALMRRGRG